MTNKSSKSIGFIILRHVNSNLTNKYWSICIESIRKFYPNNHILIIDDSSNYNYISQYHRNIEKYIKKNPINKYNTTIINSEFPRRGELLPYYYFLKNRLFDIAVIIHDSVFINKYIDFNVDKYKFIWNFPSYLGSNIADETRIIKIFEDDKLLNFYNKKLWKGCFGCMSIITHDFLTSVNEKYNISKLLNVIMNRENRCSFERVISCLFGVTHACESIPHYQRDTCLNESLLGNIVNYQGYSDIFYSIFKQFSKVEIIPTKLGLRKQVVKCKFVKNEKYKNSTNYPIIKVWTGR